MSEYEITQTTALLKELFPQVTKGQLDLVGDLIRNHSRGRAMAVIRAHRCEHEFLSFPGLKTALQADFEKYDTSRQARRKERIVDAIRYLARAKWGIQGYEGMTEEALILNHYAKCWQHVSENSPGPSGLKYVRCMIFDTVREAFLEIGKTWDEAVELARMVVELSDGERLFHPLVFKSATTPNPTAIQAIKTLAAQEIKAGAA